MLLLSLFAALLANSAEPPPAPNVCSSTICVEVLPVLSPSGQGLVRPSVRTWSEGDSSLIELTFDQLGTLMIGDSILGQRLNSDGHATLLSSCVYKTNLCRPIFLAVKNVSSEESAEQLKCQILSMLTIDPGGYGIVGKTVAVSYKTILRLKVGTNGRCEGTQVATSQQASRRRPPR